MCNCMKMHRSKGCAMYRKTAFEDQSYCRPREFNWCTTDTTRKSVLAAPRRKLWPEYRVGLSAALRSEWCNLAVTTACVIGMAWFLARRVGREIDWLIALVGLNGAQRMTQEKGAGVSIEVYMLRILLAKIYMAAHSSVKARSWFRVRNHWWSNLRSKLTYNFLF